jgi:hypothetical protein
MPSSFAGFDVKVTVSGIDYPIASEAVKVYDLTGSDPTTGVGATALSDLATDGSGHVAGGTLSIAAGRTVRFSVMRAADGLNRSFVQVTT